MSIIERIESIIKFKELNKRQFYLQTGLSNGFLDKVKSIGSDKIEIILNTFPGVNPEWLITGKGDMLKKASNVSIVSEPDAEYQKKCNSCLEKERIIAQQDVTIEVLRQSLAIMKDRIEDLQVDRDKKRNSA